MVASATKARRKRDRNTSDFLNGILAWTICAVALAGLHAQATVRDREYRNERFALMDSTDLTAAIEASGYRIITDDLQPLSAMPRVFVSHGHDQAAVCFLVDGRLSGCPR